MLITDQTPADEAYAARVASMLMASFMQQPPEPKTMLRQLTTLCLGEPKEILTRMLDPRVGVVAESDFLTLKLVKDWLERRHPSTAPEHQPFPQLPEPEIPPEERARRAKMLRALAQRIRETVKTNCVGRPSSPVQVHDADALLRGIENLEAMKNQ